MQRGSMYKRPKLKETWQVREREGRAESRLMFQAELVYPGSLRKG